jgi:hypothetical protein
MVEAEAGIPYKMKFNYEEEGDLVVYTSFTEKFPERSSYVQRKNKPDAFEVDLTNQPVGLYYFTLESDAGMKLSLSVTKSKATKKQRISLKRVSSTGIDLDGEGEYFDIVRNE